MNIISNIINIGWQKASLYPTLQVTTMVH